MNIGENAKILAPSENDIRKEQPFDAAERVIRDDDRRTGSRHVVELLGRDLPLDVQVLEGESGEFFRALRLRHRVIATVQLVKTEDSIDHTAEGGVQVPEAGDAQRAPDRERLPGAGRVVCLHEDANPLSRIFRLPDDLSGSRSRSRIGGGMLRQEDAFIQDV